MESKRGYFINIVAGEVETIEEHDSKLLDEVRKKIIEKIGSYETWNCYEIEGLIGQVIEQMKGGAS